MFLFKIELSTGWRWQLGTGPFIVHTRVRRYRISGIPIKRVNMPENLKCVKKTMRRPSSAS